MSISSFKQFLNEQEELVIDTDSSIMQSHLDKINEDLDAITASPFTNSAVFMNAVRGTLERYGVLLPANYVMPTLSAEAETVYTLGDSGMYLYICHNLNDGLVEGYAQIVDEEELNSLTEMDFEESEDEPEEVVNQYREPADRRRAADDGGNNDEYA